MREMAVWRGELLILGRWVVQDAQHRDGCRVSACTCGLEDARAVARELVDLLEWDERGRPEDDRPDPRSPIPDPRSPIPDPRSPIPDPRSRAGRPGWRPEMTRAEVLQVDALEGLRDLEADSVQAVFTSPPYFWLRDFGGGPGQIGLEDSVEDYLERLVLIFREVRRALRRDGSLWVNLGPTWNSYAANADKRRMKRHDDAQPNRATSGLLDRGRRQKDLIPVPWLVGLALQADGWLLRAEIVWAKGPSSVPVRYCDRPVLAHETILLLGRRESRRRPMAYCRDPWGGLGHSTVWTIPVGDGDPIHPATFPRALPLTALRQTTRPGDLVVDPFAGVATTGLAALELGCSFVGCEVERKYSDEGNRRLRRALVQTRLDLADVGRSSQAEIGA